MDIVTRWIGPVPNVPTTGWTDPDDPFCLEYFLHGPVPAPSAGAYLPIPRNEYAAEIACPEPEGQRFQAHNPTGSGPSTPLVLADDGWWIGAPARSSRRAFRLLAETGSPLAGALPEEIAAVEAWRPTNIPAWKAKLAWEQTDSAVATAPEVDVVTVPQTEGTADEFESLVPYGGFRPPLPWSQLSDEAKAFLGWVPPTDASTKP